MQRMVYHQGSALHPLRPQSRLWRVWNPQLVAVWNRHKVPYGINTECCMKSRLCLASLSVPQSRLGVYIIRPSDGISSMRSIVYHPCNAWYIIKAPPCIPFAPNHAYGVYGIRNSLRYGIGTKCRMESTQSVV